MYDVLEGQKEDGPQLSEREVECTLQSIGVDTSAMGLRGGGEEESEAKDGKMPWDPDSESDDAWEGLSASALRRRGGAA